MRDPFLDLLRSNIFNNKPTFGFKVGDKVKYKNYPNIKGTITVADHGGGLLVNDTLIARPEELELDTQDEFVLDYSSGTQADTKSKCHCSLRDLMMKGCQKHD